MRDDDDSDFDEEDDSFIEDKRSGRIVASSEISQSANMYAMDFILDVQLTIKHVSRDASREKNIVAAYVTRIGAFST